MPGLESTSNQLGRIDPSSLIGKAEAVVEPRATAALTDAFRQGVVTADDVISRIGELSKSREKADIMAAKEQVSPEAQALRAQQTAAGTAQAGLAEADALRKQVIQQYPAVAYFDALAPIAGIQQPTLPDGTPDYKKMEQIGAELAVHEAKKKQAAAELENITTQESADGSVLFARTKQGEFVDPSTVKRLRADATRPFMSGQPAGTVEVAPTAAAPVVPVEPRGEDMETVRARLASKYGADSIQHMPESDVLRLAKSEGLPVIEPRAAAVSAPQMQPVPTATTGVPQVGAPAGGGISLGPPAAKPVTPEDPEIRAQKLLVAKSIMPVIDNAIDALSRGAIGPREGSGAYQLANKIGAFFGVREDQYNDQQILQMSISNKILEGAQVLKGNLSDKDILFLKATVPQLNSSEAVWTEYLNRWKATAQHNIDILEGRAPKPTGNILAPQGWEPSAQDLAKIQAIDNSAGFTPEQLGNAAAAARAPATRTANKNPIVTLSSGKRVQRDAAGNFQVVQ